MKKLIGFVLGAALVSGAVPVSAQTTSSTAQLQALLDQLKRLQEQSQQLQVQREAVLTSLINTLKQGSNGEQVRLLQAILAADPEVYPEGMITGFYGQLTRKAVTNFQKKHGLPQVGHVGPRTLEKLNHMLEKNPVALEHNATSTATSTGKGRLCAIVPPGHLIAPGWLKKHDGVMPIVPPCQTLPRGIEEKLRKGTSTVDMTAPVISGLGAAVASTTATISWTTNEPATTQVMYGTTSTLGFSTAFDASLTLNHSQILPGLSTSTLYYYVVQSKDASGNLASSTQATFMTAAQ